MKDCEAAAILRALEHLPIPRVMDEISITDTEDANLADALAALFQAYEELVDMCEHGGGDE